LARICNTCFYENECSTSTELNTDDLCPDYFEMDIYEKEIETGFWTEMSYYRYVDNFWNYIPE